MDEQEKLKTEARVDELNALALAENLADLRQEVDARLTAMANEIETMKQIVAGMHQTIGNTIAQVWGHGSTVPGE